jgi:ABC-type sulfate/molybdate transport systems ATPase subunit
MSILENLSWPLAASACVFAALTSVAHAITDSIPSGGAITLTGPSGSGFVKNLQLIDGSVEVTLGSGPYFY